jgi:hypothetical protein
MRYRDNSATHSHIFIILNDNFIHYALPIALFDGVNVHLYYCSEWFHLFSTYIDGWYDRIPLRNFNLIYGE